MRLGRRRSSNVEDRRGVRLGRAGGIGLGGLVLALVAIYLGQDPAVVLEMVDQGGGSVREERVPYRESAVEAEARELTSAVLADTEETWPRVLAAAGVDYVEPRLVLFTEAVRSGCGVAPSEVGPFYCPADGTIYLDLTFFEALSERFGAPGDFGQAYVIGHEVGHHVQSLLGISEQVHGARRASSEAEANALSVRQELQADCFAGIWAHHAHRSRAILESGDVEEGLQAAAAIGDDRLSQGRASPDSFTHGSSEQRVRWFRRGLEDGSLAGCDTFDTQAL